MLLGYISTASSYNELEASPLRTTSTEVSNLEAEAEEGRVKISLDSLTELIRSNLEMDMTNFSAISRMKNLFFSFCTFQSLNGMSRIT